MNEKLHTTDLAGHCNEPTAWKILKETTRQLVERGQLVVAPSLIVIGDEGNFTLMDEATPQAGFDAPETAHARRTTASTAWSIGATMFYIVMGRQVMNGKGGAGQSPTSKLPYMRSEWPQLSELVQQCLQYAPERRPALQDILDKATEQCTRCDDDVRRGPRFKAATAPHDDGQTEQDLAFWPENMQP